MPRSRWMSPQLRAALAPLLNLAVFAGAIWIVNRLLAEYHWRDIADALAAIPWSAVALAAAITALGYLALVAYDYIAFCFAGRPLPWRAMLIPSFVTFAVSNTAPASVLTAGGVRYRMYAELGFTPAEAAAVAGFNVVTYALGLCALAGAILLVHPPATLGQFGWLGLSARSVGLLLLVGVTGYLLAAQLHRRPLSVLGKRLEFPSSTIALQQLAVSAADWVLSSAALYVLVASVAPVNYLDFLAAFFVGQAAALLLPMPGGIGVFEAVMLLVRPAGTPAPRLLGALLLYRVVYYLLPLLLAGALIAVQEIRRAREESDSPPLAALLDWLAGIAPHALAFITFLAGLLLLLTGAIPTDQKRLSWLASILPLAVIEASHFLASVIGALLLILAWGLELRIRLAYQLTRLLFGVGIVLTFARSGDANVALLLAVALLLVQGAGREFQRPASLLREPFPVGWRVAVAIALAVTLWLGKFAYRDVSYAGQLWWRFTLQGGAPRSLRAAVGMSVVVLLFAFARLLARLAPRPSRQETR